MSNNTPPPLRNYAQMVRVVRDSNAGGDSSNPFQLSVPYKLGKAYGGASTSGAETRIRSLDEIGIHSRSPNQLQAPNIDANYDRRSSTILYHQLTGDQQQFFDGISPNIAPTRQDARPGTKTRTYLGSGLENYSTSEHIAVNASSASSRESTTSSSGHTPDHGDASSLLLKNRQPTSLQTHSLPVDSRFSHEKAAPKQTRLPFVTHHSLEGTAGNSLDFSLNF
jgi:hypothetical protein